MKRINGKGGKMTAVLTSPEQATLRRARIICNEIAFIENEATDIGRAGRDLELSVGVILGDADGEGDKQPAPATVDKAKKAKETKTE